jgi:ribosomal protein S18 acetylase RimI-like enzyme
MLKYDRDNERHQAHIEIREEPLSWLTEYGRISIAFTVSSIFDIANPECDIDGLAGSERRNANPYEKDYDLIPGNKPTDWAKSFDISNWGVLSARLDGEPVGGAVIAYKTNGLLMLEGRVDQAVLWDIRISPDWRGKGLGSELLAASENWAEARGCQALKIETQNINVAACKFYAKQGYKIRTINPNAYPELPDEIQIIWHKSL